MPSYEDNDAVSDGEGAHPIDVLSITIIHVPGIGVLRLMKHSLACRFTIEAHIVWVLIDSLALKKSLLRWVWTIIESSLPLAKALRNWNLATQLGPL